jgi:L-threonylcarbamoyladenylate synthase
MIKIKGEFLSICGAGSLRFAAEALKNGSLVVFPTETVYGLGADASNKLAVSRIYEVKGRPINHPLIVHIADAIYMAKWVADIPTYAIALSRMFWPGPMTLILKRSNFAKDFITGNQDSVGIRVPNNLIAQGLLTEFHKIGGFGIAAPSANRYGQVSPTTASAADEEIGVYLNDSDLLLDGGQSNVGLESTIIDCTSELPKILRPGAITVSMIEEATNLRVDISESLFSDVQKIRVSGSLGNHYAPKAFVILDEDPVKGSGFIAMENTFTPEGVVRLAAPGSVEEFARILYKSLREGDHQNLDTIYVKQPLGEGLAVAIRDRLARSAKGR